MCVSVCVTKRRIASRHTHTHTLSRRCVRQHIYAALALLRVTAPWVTLTLALRLALATPMLLAGVVVAAVELVLALAL